MGYTLTEAQNFIKNIAPIIQEEGRKRGYSIISTAIAQAVIEGGCGTSTLAKKYHNHFGMKTGSKWKGGKVKLKTKEEYVNGKLTDVYAEFRTYKNDVEGVKGYYDFISASRYNNLKTAGSYKVYAERLKEDKYATSSSYVNTLCQTVLKYGLTKYDSTLTDTSLNNYKSIKAWYRNHYDILKVKMLQELLNKNGYTLVVDGLIGNYTISAVIDFQKKNKLTVDGKAGTKTLTGLSKVTK